MTTIKGIKRATHFILRISLLEWIKRAAGYVRGDCVGGGKELHDVCRVRAFSFGIVFFACALGGVVCSKDQHINRLKSLCDVSLDNNAPPSFTQQPLKARLMIHSGHSAAVKCIAINNDNTLVASGGEDNTVVLWHLASQKPIHRFEGHVGTISSVALRSDGKYLFTGSHDKTARMWETATAKEIRSFLGHSDRIVSLALSNDGKLLITGSVDDSIRFWEVDSGRQIRKIDWAVTCLALSSDSKLLIAGSSGGIARLWNVETGKEVVTFEGHMRSIKSVAFSNNARWIATSGADGTARLWEALTGKEVQCIGKSPQGWLNDGQFVWSMALSGDGRFMFTATIPESNIVKVLDANSGKTVGQFKGHDGVVNVMMLSHDGKQLLTVSNDDGTMRMWNVSSFRETQRFRQCTLHVNSLAMDGDATLLAVGNENGVATLWSLAKGAQIQVFEGRRSKKPFPFANRIHSIVMGSQNQCVVTGVEELEGINFWNPTNGERLRRFAEPGLLSFSVAVDDGTLAIGCLNGLAKLIDLRTSKTIQSFLIGDRSPVRAVVLSQDCKLLVTGTGELGGGAAYVWNISTGKQMRSFRGLSMDAGAVALSRDNKMLVTASKDHAAQLWSIAQNKEVVICRGHSDRINCLALNRDAKWLVTGSDDKTVRLWDVETGKELRTFRGHCDRVTAVAFSGDSKWLVTGSWDCTTRLWDTVTGNELCRLVTFDDGTWAVYDLEGRFDTSTRDVVGLYGVAGLKPIPLSQLKERYFDSGLLAKHLGLLKPAPRVVK
jgi:WD40 repeat protein